MGEGPSSALFSAWDREAGGTLLISFGAHFKAPPRSLRVRGSLRPARARLAWRSPRAAGAEAAKNGNFVPLIPPFQSRPVFWLQRLIDLLQLYSEARELASRPSGRALGNGSPPLSLPRCHSYEGRAPPQDSCHRWVLLRGFYCVHFCGWARGDMPTVKQNSRSPRSPL